MIRLIVELQSKPTGGILLRNRAEGVGKVTEDEQILMNRVAEQFNILMEEMMARNDILYVHEGEELNLEQVRERFKSN